MLRKIAAAVAAMFAAIMLLSVTAFADGPGTCTVVQTSYAEKDENFTVEVRLDNNPGVRSLGCNIRYDYQHLKVVKVENGELYQGFSYVDLGNVVSLSWRGNKKDLEADGVLAVITFKAVEAPDDGTIVYNTVTAYTGNGVLAAVDGVTTVLYFGEQQSVPEPPFPNDPSLPDWLFTDDEETEDINEEDETEDLPAETAPTTQATEPTTTPTTVTTRPTTTTRATTTTKATTTQPTTTEPPVTEPEPEPTEPVTEPEPEPEPESAETESLPEPETEPSEEITEPAVENEPAFADVYETPVNNKTANRGTILIALMAIALTAIVVIAIEMYRRGK